jgi:hemerythrin-like metal-binding protein
MRTIEWHHTLSVGIDKVDEQHRKWIEHFNTAVEAIEAQHGTEQIVRTLSFLSDYTDEHFATEEAFMRKSNYPDMEAHLVKHRDLKQTVSNLINDFVEEGTTPLLVDSIDTFLGNWLINHINEVDKKFGAYIKEHNVDLK